MNGGPSGFHNAPVSRTFVIACAILTIFLSIQGRSSSLGLSYQGIFGKLQPWRLIASQFAFSSTPELMFGLYLLYYFRVFERQIGSNKYTVFILFSLTLTSLFEVLSLTLLKDNTSRILASGPYGLIFSSFVPFYFDIPVTTRFNVFGFHFSDKSFIYLAAVQLLLSSWKKSILPGLCGVLAGSMYRCNVFGIRKMKLPQFITAFFSRLSQPPPAGSSSATLRGNISGNAPSYVGHQPERNYPSLTALSSVAEPPEDSIAMLVSMGFDRNSAREALMHARNDINVATNILLEAQSH
eukprot:TRINITY_DN632_c1_g1_i1.p1 TRINITY_DN632_c1_g1~~TRINITY_DN632_c1_g1_i1.p1  ORF type:complete len:296 (+),score=23.20 TRINITY_DN632_c1_g1_i1:359-1246(+)